ncbi:MAG: DNA-binding protein [Candidatus Hydrothermarchaeales archaeon]
MSEELEELKKRKLAELQQRLLEEKAKQAQMERVEQQIRAAIHQILTPKARARLANVKMARPEYAKQVELLLIQLAQSGQLKNKITDTQLKGILQKIAEGSKKEFKIRRV